MTLAPLEVVRGTPIVAGLASDGDQHEWRRFVDSRSARAFSRPEWGRILSESYGAAPLLFLARDKERRIVGVLPAYVVRDARGRRRMFGVRNGLAADSAEAATALLEAASAHGRRKAVASVLLGSGSLPLAFEGHLARKSLNLELGGDEEATWSKLRRETRVGVKRSVKRGAIVEWGYHNIAAFHDVFARNMLDKGVPVHSLSFFRKLREHLGDAADLIVVRNEGHVAAGMIVLWSANTLDLYLGAWLREHAPVVPYQRMYWEAIREAQRRRISVVDMGESSEGSGTYIFKRNFGCAAVDVHYFASPARSAETSGRGGGALSKLAGTTAFRFPFALRRRLATWRQAHGRLV